jgi:hypothetical protein
MNASCITPPTFTIESQQLPNDDVTLQVSPESKTSSLSGKIFGGSVRPSRRAKACRLLRLLSQRLNFIPFWFLVGKTPHPPTAYVTPENSSHTCTQNPSNSVISTKRPTACSDSWTTCDYADL